MSQWCFSQLDTWFFREARPYIFPPPARTVAGAVRTLIGEQAEVDWEAFNKGDGTAHQLSKDINICQEIGDANSFGNLRLRGIYLLCEGQRLYPVPLCLLQKDEQFTRLRPGAPVECDLGFVRLPEQTIPGAKPMETAWLTAQALKQVLAGQNPSSYYQSEDLFKIEPRLGIAINQERRTMEDGMLYQNQHIRLREDKFQLEIGVMVEGIDDALHPETGRVRFGGEGRLASVTVSRSNLPQLGHPDLSKTKNIMLTLLSPANLGENWQPDGFSEVIENNEKVWRGSINGVELTIISAVLGQPIREGGWDLANDEPREVISLIPAGSVWFCRLEKGNAADLHGYQIGLETALGRGELAVGIW
ncbi:hypothetical protein PN36_11700 [Candidatus Thiomargarita nelsonii]|uniref:Uncharacterized protein n=1 Tax=Candidatus Thiomargarita nelsonii TaxID=1003181 RepID=A0A4E0QR24_9GAMM|nr:hypothetical protein PN36_11700 [Candidatus Thiomargarita nelsonii]